MGPQRERRGPPAGPPVLLPEKVHGLRRWELYVDGAGELRLGGHGEHLWRTRGETTWAECRPLGWNQRFADHKAPAPAPRCDCGLYAIHPWMVTNSGWEHWLPPSRPLAVAGIVECWGTVQLHHEGVRAQYARPTRLVVVGAPAASGYGRLVARLAAAHDAEVSVFKTVADIARHCASGGLGLSRETVEGLLGVDAPELDR